jgi:hypothetical protein
MMKWKGCGRKREWPNFKVLPQHLYGRTEENHENPQSVEPVCGPRFEHAISRILRTSVILSTTTFVSAL